MKQLHIYNQLGSFDGITYRKMGVLLNKKNELLRRISKFNWNDRNVKNIQIGDKYIVTTTHNVGVKLQIAHELNKHDTIGTDLVAVNVNKLITTGAKPLMFLDHYTCGDMDVNVAEQVMKGIYNGCEEANCVFVGGETSESSNIINKSKYNIVGFCVGMVDKERYVNGSKIKKGDVILGLPSNGLHCNGYSFVNNILKMNELKLSDTIPWSPFKTFGEILIEPTRIYAKDIMNLRNHIELKGIAHITTGGMVENIPRMFPKSSSLGVYIDTESWDVPNIFKWIQDKGGVTMNEMRRIFNMGIGMVVVISPHEIEEAKKIVPGLIVIGEVYNKNNVSFY